MKKILLTMLVVVCSISSWADEKSYTLSFKDNGTNSDGSTAWSTSSAISNVLSAGADYVSGISATSSVYPARSGRGAKFGSSSKAGTITFTLSDAGKVKAKRVDITGGAYISNNKAEAAAIKVNGGNAVDFNQAVTSYTEETVTYNFPTATDITSLQLTQNTASSGRIFIVSVTVYYDEEDTGLETASWSLTPSTANVYKDESTVLDLITNYDGTLTFTSNNTSVATVSYDPSTKKVTVNGVNLGSTSITVTGAATSTYNAISKTIDVNVDFRENTFNKTITSSGWGYGYFGLTPEGSNTYAQPDEASREVTEGNLSITVKKNESNTKPRYDQTYLRLYNKNSIVLTAPTGYNITSVTFTEPSTNKSWAGDMTAESGVYVSADKKWYATSDVNTIELTSDNTKRIGGAIVNLFKDGYITTVKVSAAGYATYFNADNAFTVPTGMTASVWSDGLVEIYDAADVVPAGEPVVLKADAGDYDLISGTASSASFKSSGDNDLQGTATAITAAEMAAANPGMGKFYALSLNSSSDPNSVGFYWIEDNGAAFGLEAGKAYLALPADAQARAFVFNGESTGIQSVQNNAQNGVAYNLAGQRVAANAKGIVIMNGKKYLNK